jgi:DNA-binding LytR/AlgR family response regulator
MILRCLIADDEPLARNLIENYVSQTPFLSLDISCSNAIEALERINKGGIDVAFLDIQMPMLSGMEISRMIPEKTRIIFITAFEQYALEGYKVEALDYLLKPVSYADFLKAAFKARKWFEMAGRSSAEMPEKIKSIVVRSEYRQIRIELDDITYIESDKDYIHINRLSSPAVMTLMSLTSILEMLPADRFIRVHKSFIVNIDMVKTIERNLIIFDKIRIPVSDSYKDKFQEILGTKNSF